MDQLTQEVPLWHVLDVRAIWVKEFAMALAAQVPVLGWLPQISWLGYLQDGEDDLPTLGELQVRSFSLQRGFARWPFRVLTPEQHRLVRRLLSFPQTSSASPVIFCSPHYFKVAAEWKGPRVYYASDMFRFWGESRCFIEHIEKRMCTFVDLVCAVSPRVRSYMTDELGISPQKVVISAMATREENILHHPSYSPSLLPPEAAGMNRPLAGVIGNLAANTDWLLLKEVIERTPWLSWILVGPTEMPIDDPDQCKARSYLMSLGGRVRFTGYQPYQRLRDFARALDVAVLPYRRREPTYSGSSTRFYEHLAACRPILATRGFAELLLNEPLLRFGDTAEELALLLEELREQQFRDGNEELRWEASRSETWEARAAAVRRALQERMGEKSLV
ncbi:MAG: glycosyltransferase family 4 protein [Acidobacteria bacterium]|nr:glycosyltransferase family 4 protein [Acidobacteriota bacterium]